MSDETFVTIESAARTTGIAARTLRYWIETGKLTATAEKRGKRVSLADVDRLGRLTGKVSGTAASPPATVPTSAIAVPAVATTPEVAVMFDRLDVVYRDRLNDKDQTIAVQQTTIEALRDRLSALEAQRAESPATTRATPASATGARQKPRQRRWWLRIFGVDE